MSEITLLVALGTLIVSLVTLAAMVEMYVSLSAVQDAVGLGQAGKNEVVLLEEHTKTVISRPAAEIGLDVPQGKPAWYVLFLSTHCRLCNTIARSLAQSLPLSLSVVVLGESPESASRWIQSLDVDASCLLTPDPEMFDPLGFIITPSVLVVIGDEMAYVAGLESKAALDRVVQEKYVPPEALALRAGVASQ